MTEMRGQHERNLHYMHILNKKGINDRAISKLAVILKDDN